MCFERKRVKIIFWFISKGLDCPNIPGYNHFSHWLIRHQEENPMRALKVVVSCALGLLIGCGTLFAGEQQQGSGFGEELARQLWADISKGDSPSIERWFAEEFQSIHQDGAKNRDQELEIIKNLNLGEYKLSNFTVTQEGPALIVTYLVSAEEGQRLPRLSVFLSTDTGWKLIAHASPKPVKED
jgi:hypothetical protein